MVDFAHGSKVQEHWDDIQTNPSIAVLIRAYDESDAAATLSVFMSAVTVTAAADYTAEQIEAWAQPNERDLRDWNAAMLARNAFVAEVGGEVVGFSDVDRAGYIDMMFVSPGYQRRGIACSLLDHAGRFARSHDATSLSANVSVTARPFFERCGFVVEVEQHSMIKGVELLNFSMRLTLR